METFPGALTMWATGPTVFSTRDWPTAFFKLSGRTGDVAVDYTSTEPVEDLLADAMGLVSGIVSSTPGGAGA